MDLVAVARIAVRALARNKMRSSLTMLGIIIGVGAVIAMVGVGQGAQQQVQQQIAAMGSNILFVGSGTVTRGGTHMGWGATKTLVYADMLAILRECPAVKAAAPGSNTSSQVVFGNDNWATRINGTEPQYFDIRNWPFQEGTAFTQEDVDMAANVAVIGESVRKNLFGAADPLGQTIRIKSLPFRSWACSLKRGPQRQWAMIRMTWCSFPSQPCKRRSAGRIGYVGSWSPPLRVRQATLPRSRSHRCCGIVTAFVSGRTTTSWYGTWPTWLTWQTRPAV